MTGPVHTREKTTSTAGGTDGEAHRGIDSDGFRQALAAHPAGVVVVTASTENRPVGLTATSFTSVSLDPPLIAFYIASGSSTWNHLRHSKHFAISMLAEDQQAVAHRFASRGDRFAHPTRWHTAPNGAPLIDGAAAHLLCSLEDTHELGDHWLVVGRVHEADVHRPDNPLLYHRGTFHTLH